MAKLRNEGSVAARALEFTILTAARSGEVRFAKWHEIDFAEKLWVVPSGRMKSGREHRVPLAPRSIEILREAKADGGEYIFPGRRAGTALSSNVMIEVMKRIGITGVTVHGFRSSFRDWVSDSTAFSGEVAEIALAHVVGDETERAYRRGDMLAKRFALAEAWSSFLAKPSIKDDAKVISIGAKK
jgi:integrase